MKDKSKILARLKKIMALSESPDPGEAAAALRKAAALMAEYGITEAEVKLAHVGEYDVHGNRKNLTDYESLLVHTVAGVFGCAFILVVYDGHGVYRSTNKVVFMGVSPAADIAGYAYEVLLRKLRAARRHYLARVSRRYKKANRTRKANAYALGWASGCARAAEELLPIQEPGVIVSQYQEQMYPSTVTTKARKTGDIDDKKTREDAWAGYVDGSQERIAAGVNAGATTNTGLLNGPKNQLNHE